MWQPAGISCNKPSMQQIKARVWESASAHRPGAIGVFGGRHAEAIKGKMVEKEETVTKQPRRRGGGRGVWVGGRSGHIIDNAQKSPCLFPVITSAACVCVCYLMF